LFKRQAIYFIFLILFLSCKTNKNIIKENKYKNSGLANCSPNGCIISGTILFIYPTLDTNDSLSPCSKAPCNAKIKIEQVLEYGNRLSSNIYEGLEMNLHFVFTLYPTTNDLFHDTKKYFPGLKINDKFNANLEERLQLNNDTIQWLVYDYVKL